MEIWWLTTRGKARWSDEEVQARKVLYAVALLIFVVLFFVILLLLEFWGVDETTATLISLAIGGFSALFISRFICGLIWPRLFQRADRNAAHPLGLRKI
ncbi:MAG: hypothetical protein JOZ15_04050 [Acidobacteria bacterium]|nr:hypothetical protein [Acidobacteriota bacterium]